MIYLILPAYNEEKSFVKLFEKVDNFFKNDIKQDYRIVVCDDGSRDKTSSMLEDYKNSF